LTYSDSVVNEFVRNREHSVAVENLHGFVGPREIAALDLTQTAIRNAVSDALLAAAAGRAGGGQKAQIDVEHDTYFQALPAYSHDARLAGVKWVSICPGQNGRPSIQATMILNDIQTGSVVRVLDATWITLARTSAMSAIAAEALAHPGSEAIGLIGAGAQARGHLEALQDIFPKLSTVTIFDRSGLSSESFTEFAQGRGLSVSVASDPRDAVAGHDIVVSTIPLAGLEKPFLDARWLKEGAFATLVDLGRSWNSDTLGALQLVVTDDRAQSQALHMKGAMSYDGDFAYTLGDLAAGARPPSGTGRRALIFGGTGLADLAVAALVHQSIGHSL
jgi:ornithine cyclodeaminase/alanine dehydrogenase